MANKIESLEAKKQILSSEFHQYYYITLSEFFESTSNQTINVVIPFEKILNVEEGYGLAHLLDFFNDDFSNVLVTHSTDFNIVHQVECYKNVFYIKLKPYTNVIALHILPKTYDTTDNILFFKDENITEDNTTFTSSEHYAKHDNVSLYFQDEEGDRDPSKKPYTEFDKFDAEPKLYATYENGAWKAETYENTFGEYNFDIRNREFDNMQNVQINVGYKYNDSSPTNAVHYTGTKDITTINHIDRCVLIDANFDNITANSNVIEQLEFDENHEIIFPTTASPVNEGFTNTTGLHSANIGKLYHKTIKYFNDEMYSEEYDGSDVHFMNNEWIDLSLPQTETEEEENDGE